MPPAGLVGLPDHLEECLALPGVCHSVHGEQVDHVPLLEADPAQLESADLRLGGADGVTGFRARDLGGYPQPAQPRAQHDAAGGRATTLRTTTIGCFSHSVSPGATPYLRCIPPDA